MRLVQFADGVQGPFHRLALGLAHLTFRSVNAPAYPLLTLNTLAQAENPRIYNPASCHTVRRLLHSVLSTALAGRGFQASRDPFL